MTFEKIEINQTDDGAVRLLQVTDPHLFASERTELLGVNTYRSFSAVIDAIAKDQSSFDYVLSTGDLSQDHTEESYRRFADVVSLLNKPCFYLPGNHDQQQHMQRLPEWGLLPQKHLVSEHWQVIMLDTQVSGKPHGMLADAELARLEAALKAHPDKYVLIVMHHHTVPVGCKWLDQHDVKNAHDFFSIIDGYPKVRGALCGHVHQNFEFQRGKLAVFASPSTCIQFLPLSAAFALDHQQPGWRYIKLCRDGSISTRVRRLPDKSFLPDPKSKGY